MSQRRKILPMLVLLMMLCTIGAQTAEDQSLLWKVSHPQSSHTSYIFGTIHLQDSTVFRQRDTVLTLLHTCTTFAAELHLDSAQKIMMMDPFTSMFSSVSLYERMDSALVDRLLELAEQRLPSDMAERAVAIRPGLLAAALSIGTREKTATMAMDVFLWNRAKRKGLQLVGLEQFSEQLQLLDAEGIKELIRIANDTVVTTWEDIDQMVDAYCREDLRTLASMANDSSIIDRENIKVLNDERNHRMVERMIPLLERGHAFIATGALHLTGPSSLILLLRQRGWTVEPVLGGQRRQWLPPSYIRRKG